MTTLAVNAISSFARGGVQALTQLAVSTATGAISRALDNRVFDGPRMESFHLQTSRDGAPMPRVFGRVRLAGQVIWSSAVREIVTEEEVGGKGGGPTQRNYSYTVSFAVGLCEGEIVNIDRIWANGALLGRSGVTLHIHHGTEDQGPNPVIAATEPGDVPAFRGTAYIVFEDFPLDDFGGRLPNINAEVVRAGRKGGAMESLVQAVNLLPGTGEFALDPVVVEETPRVGETIASNMNNFTGEADMIASLDQLEAELPNCRHVSIISAWFGSSLDAGECVIQPGVEQVNRRLPERTWRVAGVERGQAYVVSADEEGRANYGGTPSDDSLIACIRELRRRGFKVTLYPFLLMDMPGFPWRGRIKAETQADIDAFFGTDDDFRFRHHILHHARLAKEAGGVGTIVIGSELKALMASRVDGAYPAVDAMRQLAFDVGAISPGFAKLTYAADWSDYFGTWDGNDLIRHLDPLWADIHIAGVGIDAYFPLSDWRDGDSHLDYRPGVGIHDTDYLRANVEGGEGYDWYYINTLHRDDQIRTPITDPAFRYKDLRHWWSHEHRNLVDGEWSEPTDWRARQKPIWLLEVGCPAVDKGANQPNVFFDGRSIDGARPYYSSGARDDLIQRRYIEALLGHYTDTNEPGFIDLSRAAVWAWDLRPYPSFPARLDIWSDGENWARGHWLNGRTGLTLVADVIDDLARESGLTDIDVSGVGGVLPGYAVDRPMSARAAIAPLLQLFAVDMNERGGAVVFSTDGGHPFVLSADDLIAGPVRRTRADSERRIRDVRLTYLDAARDYQTASVSARERAAESVATLDMSAPAVIDEGFARHVVERELAAAHAGEASLRFSLPLLPGLQFEPGDRLAFDTDVWTVETTETGAQVDVTARRDVREGSSWVRGATPDEPSPLIHEGAAQLLAFDLPGRGGISVGALLSPWRPVEVSAPGGVSAVLRAPLRIGATLSALPCRDIGRMDDTTALDILIPNLSLSSQPGPSLRFAVETDAGWEIVAAQRAELIAPDTYRLSCLLRGLDGSDAFMADRAAGARVVWLGEGLETVEIGADWLGSEVEVTGGTATRAARPANVVWNDLAGLPFTPTHLRRDGDLLRWNGRGPGRREWDDPPRSLRFRLRLHRGDVVETEDVTGTSFVAPGVTRVEVFGLSASGRQSPLSVTLNVAGS